MHFFLDKFSLDIQIVFDLRCCLGISKAGLVGDLLGHYITRLSSSDPYSLHSEGSKAVLVRSTQLFIKMKFLVFFFLCLVALSAAAPQYFAWPGYVAPAFGSRTVVAGPTVVNGFDSRYVSPGFIGVY